LGPRQSRGEGYRNICKVISMIDKPKKKRHPTIRYRIPAGREQEFFTLVDRAKSTVNGFITSRIFDQPIPRQSKRPTVSERDSGKTVGLLGQIKREIGDLREDLIGIEDTSQRLQKILAAMERIENLLLEYRWASFKSLGRKP